MVASDAMFPFADGLIACAEAGATAAIQPGGSMRDQEVIDAGWDRNVIDVRVPERGHALQQDLHTGAAGGLRGIGIVDVEQRVAVR